MLDVESRWAFSKEPCIRSVWMVGAADGWVVFESANIAIGHCHCHAFWTSSSSGSGQLIQDEVLLISRLFSLANCITACARWDCFIYLSLLHQCLLWCDIVPPISVRPCCSPADFKLGLTLDHFSILLVQLNNVGMAWSNVYMLEKSCDGVIFALGFTLHL